jgi:hypothetical protein
MRGLLSLLLVSLLATPYPRILPQEASSTPAGPEIAIGYPIPGQALQGLVRITGILQVEGFIYAELDFAYQNDPRDTWFVIWHSDRVPDGQMLAEWDTTTLTDGDYELRLTVKTETNELESLVSGLRVRNYSPIETDTPQPTATPAQQDAPQDTSVPAPTATASETPIPPTPTPLPTNPAELTPEDVTTSLGRGALAAIGIFALLGLYQLVRKSIRR